MDKMAARTLLLNAPAAAIITTIPCLLSASHSTMAIPRMTYSTQGIATLFPRAL